MKKVALLFLVLLFTTSTTQAQSSYQELADLFGEWRDFESAEMKDGVPDYSFEAMARQYADLPAWQSKLASIDTTSWSVANQIDWYIVWAEMNGLDFAHRVKRPWQRDPAYYVWFYEYLTDVPEREAPNIEGNIQWAYFDFPLSDTDATEIADRLRNAPALYEKARVNLTGQGRDLWRGGIRSIKSQSSSLESLAKEYQSSHPELASAMLLAKKASDSFLAWLEDELPSRTESSGVGKENYTWNLKNVHLLPYTWDEQVAVMDRELARANSSLALEGHRNRNLPKMEKMDDAKTYADNFESAIDFYLQWLDREEVVSMKDYMEPALEARINEFTPFEGIRGFFWEINYRDLLPMRTHDYHWIDLARMREEPHASPIRKVPSLYNIFDGRAEGMATGMEEMMMHAGLMDDRPRVRELIWILLAQRAARGLGGLYQHGLEMDLDESAQFASENTPWGLLPADGSTIIGEEHFYLRQPAYGTSYVIGKIEIEKLIAKYSLQREGAFVLKEFMDAFNDAGMIPVSLMYWEMTGDRSMLDDALGR